MAPWPWAPLLVILLVASWWRSRPFDCFKPFLALLDWWIGSLWSDCGDALAWALCWLIQPVDGLVDVLPLIQWESVGVVGALLDAGVSNWLVQSPRTPRFSCWMTLYFVLGCFPRTLRFSCWKIQYPRYLREL